MLKEMLLIGDGWWTDVLGLNLFEHKLCLCDFVGFCLVWVADFMDGFVIG